MKLYLQFADADITISRGPLVGHKTPWATRSGIPVGHPKEFAERNPDQFQEATPGMVLVHLREDVLYAVTTSEGAVPLALRVASIGAGLTQDGELLEECAKAAHEAWLEEKVKRMREIYADEIRLAGEDSVVFHWPSEAGEEQLVHWDILSEPVREFDRIVVRAIMSTLRERGLAR